MKEEYNELIKDIITNDKVKSMDNFIQHCDTTTLEHSKEVSYLCYKICKKLKLDYKSATRASLLHDFYLYEWRTNKERWHEFKHPYIALKNAEEEFNLNRKEKNMIKTHMWPLTIIPPSSLEGLVLTLVYKYSATKEIISYIKKRTKESKSFRYAYLLVLFIIRKF
ncbi:MAG: HDIG domain-containing protein [Tenericutes bacterium]|nr:HDIG domain-containing protein [Mycoplasmatota bacterium]